MKKLNKFVLKNKAGEILRVIDWGKGKLYVVKNLETGRIEFTDDVQKFENEQIKIKILHELTKTSVGQSMVLAPYGIFAPMTGDETLRPTTRASEEEEDQIPVIMKWTAGGYAATIAIILLTSFITQRFFNDEPETVVVQVIKQERTFKTSTVQAAKKKINRRQKVSKRKTPRKKVVTSNTRSRRHKKAKTSFNKRASAVNIHKVGALGALGGLNKKMRGAGGLNMKAAKNNAGIAYGGAAAKGGHERSLIGKGLIAAGAGNGSTKGYGGYGTKGQGGGRPGYGSMKMGGSSSAFFQPLSDESLIDGGLDRGQIEAVINRNAGQITYCYEQGLQKDPSLKGRVEVKFVISPYGKVSAAKINNSSLGARRVENCIVSKLRQWKFPKPVGQVNVRVKYPFNLKRLSQG